MLSRPTGRIIAAYIKQLDRNHLVMDGYYAIDPVPVREESLSDPMIDIVSSHHYEGNPERLRAHIRTNLEMVRGRKPYVVGEFGFVGTSAVERVLDDAIVVLGSPDGQTFGPLPVRREGFALGDEDYGYWLPTLYSGEGREDDRYLKIVFRTPAQLSRVEIGHFPGTTGGAPAPSDSQTE